MLLEWLRFAGSLYLILFAAIALALLVVCPQGVSGLAERGWNVLRRKSGGAR
ncbi:ABC transporter permease OS=Bosea thiooxidans OX=53254 GN=ARD30_00455 PE=4 SV=1 [Bosea thiooxidans]